MSQSGLIKADVPALQKTVRDLNVVAADIGAVGLALQSVPTPTAATHGWNGAADAMAAVLSGWAGELDLFHQAMDEMTAQMNADIENLLYADERARMFGGMHGL